MRRKTPCWNSDAASATVLMEYLKRASPEFIAAELDELGLLDAADEAATAVLEEVVTLRAADRVSGRSVRDLSESGVEHALCDAGLEPDELDREMAAWLRARKITCRDDVQMPVPKHERTNFWQACLLLIRPKLVESVLPHRLVAAVTFAMCAVILIVAQASLLGSISSLPENAMSQFTQLAGPTPEW